VETVESFEHICNSLALDTNIGRFDNDPFVWRLIKEKATEIEAIHDQCLETGLLQILGRTNEKVIRTALESH
jgi:hypothetical protein